MGTQTNTTLPKCPHRQHNTGSYSVIHYGKRKTNAGNSLRYLCKSSTGAVHYFTVLTTGTVKIDGRSKQSSVSCPNPKHKSARVQSKGTRSSSSGIWSRFYCEGVLGEHHSFRILSTADGAARVSVTKPPACPEHSKSKVVRHGTKGSGPTKRQGYRCTPTEGAATHYFSPPLTREAVAPLASCSGCDELLSPHRGSLTASRHTPWTLAAVVQALNNLSLGLSYAAVSRDLRAQNAMTREHLRAEHGAEAASRSSSTRSKSGDGASSTSRTSTGRTSTSSTSRTSTTRAQTDATSLPTPTSSTSSTSTASTSTSSTSTASITSSSSSLIREEGRNAWHLAADLVEEYSPLLFGTVIEKVIARERKARAANDAILEANPEAVLAAPIVYLLDDAPIYIKQWKSARSRHQQDSWALLVVVELIWQPAKDPFGLPRREARLRLARAYPRANEEAWMLVLNELPVTPDFIIADAGPAIKNAVDRRYAGEKVTFIPSLFHIQKNLRKVLEKLPNASSKSGKRVYLAKALYEAVSFMTRDGLIQSTEKGLAKDWDELIALITRMGAPTADVKMQRKLNESKMADAISILAKNPHLPASNAAVEAKIRLNLEPFLENRQYRFRNLARTNYLLDLAVARSQGIFTDLGKLSKLIRQSNEEHSGWAPTPRQITDRQPLGAGANTPIYSSLLNAQLISRLSKARGIAPASPKPVRGFPNKIKNPGVGSGRPKGSKNKPKQVTP